MNSRATSSEEERGFQGSVQFETYAFRAEPDWRLNMDAIEWNNWDDVKQFIHDKIKTLMPITMHNMEDEFGEHLGGELEGCSFPFFASFLSFIFLLHLQSFWTSLNCQPMRCSQPFQQHSKQHGTISHIFPSLIPFKGWDELFVIFGTTNPTS